MIDDDRDLAGAIIALLRDDERRRRMGRQGADIVRSRFDVGVVIEDWERLIAGLAV